MTAPAGLTIGPRVMGQAAYDAAVAKQSVTGNLTIGSRVTGPLKRLRTPEVVLPAEAVEEAVPHGPAATATTGDLPLGEVSVAEGLKRLRAPNADLQALWAQEMARGAGPRATLVAEFQRRGGGV